MKSKTEDVGIRHVSAARAEEELTKVLFLLETRVKPHVESDAAKLQLRRAEKYLFMLVHIVGKERDTTHRTLTNRAKKEKK